MVGDDVILGKTKRDSTVTYWIVGKTSSLLSRTVQWLMLRFTQSVHFLTRKNASSTFTPTLLMVTSDIPRRSWRSWSASCWPVLGCQSEYYLHWRVLSGVIPGYLVYFKKKMVSKKSQNHLKIRLDGRDMMLKWSDYSQQECGPKRQCRINLVIKLHVNKTFSQGMFGINLFQILPWAMRWQHKYHTSLQKNVHDFKNVSSFHRYNYLISSLFLSFYRSPFISPSLNNVVFLQDGMVH